MSAIVAVIKYNGGPDDLAWRFPSEGIGTWSKLLVNESQEAVLFFNGQPYDSFTTGEYELSTWNIPLLSQILGLPAGGRLPLTVDIWYINMGYALEVKWGTPAPIQVLDQKYNALIPMRATGQISVRFNKPKAFFINNIGIMQTFDKDNLIRYFRALCLNRLNADVLAYHKEKDISILEINTHLSNLTEYSKEKILPVMADLTVEMVDFRINSIKLSEDSPVVRQFNEALAKKAVVDMVGEEYIQEQPLEMPGYAAPVSNAAGAMHIPVSGAMQIDDPFVDKTCPVCYNDLDPKSRYCSECNYDTLGEDADVSNPGLADRLETESGNGEPENETEQALERISTKKCPGCKTDMDIQARFCSRCGKDTHAVNSTIKTQSNSGFHISVPSASSQSDVQIVRTCSRCGTKLRESQKFCHKCGFKP